MLQPYLDQGVKRVVVTAPVKSAGALDVVMGVNHQRFDPAVHRIVSAASLHHQLPGAGGQGDPRRTSASGTAAITTIHSLTNTQTIIDAPHKDLRRARSCGSSLIPTSTGSATAIAEIFPELKGRLEWPRRARAAEPTPR